MKAGRRIIVGILCCMMLLSGCTLEDDSDTPVSIDKKDEKEEAVQSKLNALQPHAYGNVQGLTLEPSSTISVIGRGEKSAYWSAIKSGAQAAIDELNQNLGYQGDDKIKLSYSGANSENDVDDQVNILDEELDRYPVAVGIALADSTASQVQFDLAEDNGIPVVAFDSGTDHKNVVCMVDTDNVEAATTAAGKLCDAIGDSGEILMFVHDSSSTSAKGREEGFTAAMESVHQEVTVGGVYHLDDLSTLKKEIAEQQVGEVTDLDEESLEEAIHTAADKLTQEDVVRYIFETHPEARGVYTTSETATEAVLSVLDTFENQEEYKVVAFDGGESQLKRLEEGKLSGLIVQNPYGIGYATVVACVRATMGEGNEAVVDAGYTWVTAKNMKEEAIQNMMY